MAAFRIILLALLAAVAASGVRAQDKDAEVGKQLAKALGCEKCHGATGVSGKPSIPNLAGQKIEYVQRQLEAFRRTGPLIIGGEIFRQRDHPFMDTISVILTDRNIRSLAAYYGQLACARPREKPLAEAPKNARLCETCHGGHRANPFGYSPNLNAQHEAYLLSQMKDFIGGRFYAGGKPTPAESTFRSHRLMSELLDGDLRALARYYAALACR